MEANMIHQNQRVVILPLLLMLLLAGCAAQSATVASANVVEAMSAPAGGDFARAYEPIAFKFPRDHGAHNAYATEWWYYTGNLTTADLGGGDAFGDGREFGYQLTFFRSALSADAPARNSELATNQVYMAHFAVTDVRSDEHYSFDRYSRGAGELAGAVGEPLYEVWLDEWSAREIEPGVQRLHAEAEHEAGTVAIDFVLRETRDPLLHGERGLSQKGAEPGNASYYYSLVGLETAGTVTSGGETFEVSGVSWMDHEFGTSALAENAVGWDWFSAQLDNGALLMFAQIRTAAGEALDTFKGTLVYPDGEQIEIGPGDFTLTETDEWTSPRTGITYPAGWHVDFTDLDISLLVEPLAADQEMDVSFVYWEGAVAYDGTMNGEPVTGRGYVELTGYAAQGFQR